MSKFSLVTWWFLTVGCLCFYRRPSNSSNLLRSVNKIYNNAISLQHHPSVLADAVAAPKQETVIRMHELNALGVHMCLCSIFVLYRTNKNRMTYDRSD